MKYCYCLLACCLLSFMATAGNYTGGTISYTWLHDSTYRFYVTLLGPCDSSAAPASPNASLCYFNSCNTQSGSMALTLATSPATTPPNYQQYLFTGEFTLPSRCNYWTFYTAVAGRDTMVNAATAGTNMYLEATLNNETQDHLSGPYHNTVPPPCYPIGVAYTLNWGMIDPDNDSMSVEVIAPRTATPAFNNAANCATGAASAIAFYTPYNTATPFAATGLSISTYGQIAFTPISAGHGKNILTTRVNKYRNGIKKGSVMQETELRFVNNVPYTSPAYSVLPATVSGCAYDTAGIIYAYANTPMQFCFYVKKPNAVLLLSDNHAVACNGSSRTYTGQWSDSVSFCMNWTPSVADTPMRMLTVMVQDGASASCNDTISRPVFNMQLLFPIHVNQFRMDAATIPAMADVHIYPNPAGTSVRVAAPVPTNVSCYNMTGQLLLQFSGRQAADISAWPAGVYLLRIYDNAGRLLKTERLLKQQD